MEPRCPNPTTYRGRCERHAKQRNQQTKSVNAPIYNSKRWQILRRHKLGLNPICERCDNTLANHVHHIVDIQKGGVPFAIGNLEALCHSCHSRITRGRQTT
jgi:5-methylcytosine-specific restriction endonuclease McrA